MEDGETQASTDELEVVEMLRVDPGMRVDLERVVVVRRILEETVEGIELQMQRQRMSRTCNSDRTYHLVRQQEEEFSRQTTVIETILSIELDHQSLLEIVWSLPHNFGIRILKDVSSSDLDVTLSRNRSKSRLGAEVDEFPPKVSLVLRYIELQARWKTRIVPRCSLGIVIDKVDSCSRCKSHLPS